VLHFRDPAETGRKRQILPRRSHCTWIHLGAEHRSAIAASEHGHAHRTGQRRPTRVVEFAVATDPANISATTIGRAPSAAALATGDLAQRPVHDGHARAGDSGF
jgi:hypothetical protein